MNKQELIAQTAKNSGLSKARLTKSLDALCDTICQALGRQESVSIFGFGKFYLKYQSERLGRNLKTGERVEIPARNVPAFQPGAWIYEALEKA